SLCVFLIHSGPHFLPQ
ncbi:Branched-chain amino acid transport system 2 carrier protein, partial [Haemophilus influenzae]